MGSSEKLRKFGTLRDHFEAHDQGHVFGFWEGLDVAGRERLLSQAADIDLPALMRAYERQRGHADAGPPDLQPLSIERLPEHGGDPARAAAARERGLELLGAGRVAALVVAGGQATRLGYPGPKGGFPLGPVSKRTLFELQAQKLRGVRRRSGRALPWYVMTSDATDAATRELFEASDYFGVPAEDVFFFQQGMVPSFDFDGKLILEQPDRIFQNPNGHGGSLVALETSGALDDMERRDIDTIFYYQVDNPLVRMADPTFLGFHAGAEAEMSCKVVAKIDPEEKVGILARANGRVGVVEYTELDDSHRHARDAAGALLYWAGNTAIHAISTGFVRRVAEAAEELLPYHASAKKIPAVDAHGSTVAPEKPNGYKLERFVFDALAAAGKVCVVETARLDEYSPVKNAEGSDSPATARRDLVAQTRRWLAGAGIELPPEELPIEVDHARVDGPEDARALGIHRIEEASDVIQVGPGVEA